MAAAQTPVEIKHEGGVKRPCTQGQLLWKSRGPRTSCPYTLQVQEETKEVGRVLAGVGNLLRPQISCGKPSRLKRLRVSEWDQRFCVPPTGLKPATSQLSGRAAD